MSRACATCGRPDDGSSGSEVRPYGKGGSLICFNCASDTPEAEAEAKRQFAAKLAEAGKPGSVAVLTANGPIALDRCICGAYGPPFRHAANCTDLWRK